jgi:hypothetical protein
MEAFDSSMADLLGIRALLRDTGAASLTGALRFVVDIMGECEVY